MLQSVGALQELIEINRTLVTKFLQRTTISLQYFYNRFTIFLQSFYINGGLARKAAANNAAGSRQEAVPADPWLFGKPAQARIPLEVRLPEQLEVRLHKLCAKGGGEFTVKILPPADHSEADDHTAMVLAPQHQVASAQAAQQLTLIEEPPHELIVVYLTGTVRIEVSHERVDLCRR